MLGSHRSLCLDRRGSSLVIIRTDIIELVISVIPCVVKSERFPAMCRRACRRSQVAVKLWETPTGVPPTIGETGDRWDGELTLSTRWSCRAWPTTVLHWIMALRLGATFNPRSCRQLDESPVVNHAATSRVVQEGATKKRGENRRRWTAIGETNRQWTMTGNTCAAGGGTMCNFRQG
jgi:hypothetical protein